MFDSTSAELLDAELKPIDYNEDEGKQKIEEARKLLPVHYANLVASIGGKIDDDIDLNRLPKSIKALVDIFTIETPQLGTLTNTMVASMIYTNLFGKFRPVIRDTNVSKKVDIPCNVIAINVSGSGSGKDLAFDLGMDILKKSDKLILDTMYADAEKKAINTAISKNRKQLEKDGKLSENTKPDDSGWEEYLTVPTKGEIKMATYEALLAESENILKSGDKGNLFLKMSELGNSLKLDPNIDRLIMLFSEMYDVGKVPEDLKKTKELKTGAIEGLAPSMLAHTSPTPLLRDPKLLDKVKSIFGSYLARRSFTLFTNLNESVQGIDLMSDLDKQAELKADSAYTSIEAMTKIEDNALKAVQRLIDNPHLNVITLTDKARRLYNKYYLINRVYRYLAYLKDENFSNEIYLTELINRHWKAIKLAGIWALAENKSEITVELIGNAIYFTELSGKGLRKLMDLIDVKDYERFIRSIENSTVSGTIRFDTLVKQGYINRADKSQISVFITTVNSALQGKAIVTPNYEKSIVEINNIELSKGNYAVSYIKFNKGDSKEYRADKSYKGFKYVKLPLKSDSGASLVNMLNTDLAYSPFQFKDGYRSNANIISETNFIVFDIDKESTIDMKTLHETYLSGTLHIISTTSDPTNLYKYRLLLPIKQKIGSNPQIYKYVMMRVAEELMLSIDPSCTVLSQCMYSYSESIVLDNIDSGIEPMDISDILRDSAVQKLSVDYTTPLSKTEQKKEQQMFLHDFENAFEGIINCPDGRGSYLLYSTMRRLERAGLDKLSIETLIHKINSHWKVPMNRDRLERTILSQIKAP